MSPVWIQYAENCAWLIIPILLLNAALMRRLPKAYQPEVFERDIPTWLTVAENIFRVLVFALTLFMRLDPTRKIGLTLYGIGAAVYALAWVAQIARPQSAWSTSPWGFLAPGYTPVLWLAGIGLIGNTLFLPIPYSPWIYMALAAAFLAFHNTHAAIVYRRNYAASGPRM